MKRQIGGASALVIASLAIPAVSHAESTFNSGVASPLTATAHLDFTITIPKFIYVRVSSGTNFATGGTIDNLVYNVAAANVGSGTAVTAFSGGDISPGVVTARVIGNNGNITFTATTAGAMSDGTGDSISWAQINTAAAVLTSATALPPLALVDGGAGTNETLAPNVGTKVVNLDAKWTYTYLNQNIVPPGAYGATVANNSRVTYTASEP